MGHEARLENFGNRSSAIRLLSLFTPDSCLPPCSTACRCLWQPLIASFESLDPPPVDASAVLGADRARTFARHHPALAWPGVLTALVLSFAHTLREFGRRAHGRWQSPRRHRTVSIDIYDRVQALDYAAAPKPRAAPAYFVCGAFDRSTA